MNNAEYTTGKPVMPTPEATKLDEDSLQAKIAELSSRLEAEQVIVKVITSELKTTQLQLHELLTTKEAEAELLFYQTIDQNKEVLVPRIQSITDEVLRNQLLQELQDDPAYFTTKEGSVAMLTSMIDSNSGFTREYSGNYKNTDEQRLLSRKIKMNIFGSTDAKKEEIYLGLDNKLYMSAGYAENTSGFLDYVVMTRESSLEWWLKLRNFGPNMRRYYFKGTTESGLPITLYEGGYYHDKNFAGRFVTIGDCNIEMNCSSCAGEVYSKNGTDNNVLCVSSGNESPSKRQKLIYNLDAFNSSISEKYSKYVAYTEALSNGKIDRMIIAIQVNVTNEAGQIIVDNPGLEINMKEYYEHEMYMGAAGAAKYIESCIDAHLQTLQAAQQ